MDVTYVTVQPEEGNVKAIAKALLEAAVDPRQVQMVTYPRTGFLVPEEVFHRFKAQYDPQSGEQSAQGEDAPKRRGRPRKAVADATLQADKEE